MLKRNKILNKKDYVIHQIVMQLHTKPKYSNYAHYWPITYFNNLEVVSGKIRYKKKTQNYLIGGKNYTYRFINFRHHDDESKLPKDISEYCCNQRRKCKCHAIMKTTEVSYTYNNKIKKLLLINLNKARDQDHALDCPGSKKDYKQTPTSQQVQKQPIEYNIEHFNHIMFNNAQVFQQRFNKQQSSFSNVIPQIIPQIIPQKKSSKINQQPNQFPNKHTFKPNNTTKKNSFLIPEIIKKLQKCTQQEHKLVLEFLDNLEKQKKRTPFHFSESFTNKSNQNKFLEGYNKFKFNTKKNLLPKQIDTSFPRRFCDTEEDNFDNDNLLNDDIGVYDDDIGVYDGIGWP